MQGDLDSERFRGIIPRMVDNVFEKIGQASESLEFTVKAAMLEIYNEKIRDLLDPSKNNLSVREDKQRGIYVDGLTEKSIGNEKEVYGLMKEGNDNRAVGATNMNAQSSRSHSIFLMSITMNDVENLSCKTGKLFLVDLAGSEVISKTGAKGQTLEEAKGINKSLTMLGRVINALTDGKSAYIPYRDSKLTRILQESLGGNSKTCLIITASPSMYNALETLSTCRFGMRAKSIKNNAKINKLLTVAELKLVVARLEKELEVKGRRIMQLEDMIVHLGGTIPPDDENFKVLEEGGTSTTDESQEEKDESPEKTPKPVGPEPEFPPVEKAVSAPVLPVAAPPVPPPVEEIKKPEVVVKLVGDQVDQQKSKQKVSDLEKQRDESGKDLDTLLDQLKKERKKLKLKDARLCLFKQEMIEKTNQIEQYQREAQALVLSAAELRRKLQKMEEQLTEKDKLLDQYKLLPAGVPVAVTVPVQGSEEVKSNQPAGAQSMSLSISTSLSAVSQKHEVTTISPVKQGPGSSRESLVIKKLLEDDNLGVKIKEYIKNVVTAMNVPVVSPTKVIVNQVQESPETKGRRYTDSELKRLMDDVANKEKKRYEEGNKLLVNKIEQLKKGNNDLNEELKKQKETCRLLENVGNTVL